MAEKQTIGVILRPTDTDVELQIPRKGWLSNTGRGAMRGSVIGAYGIYCGYGFFLCVPAFATVGAIGGAIYGAVRADFYWGFGDAAGAEAGKMKQQGRMWVLLPKGYDPNTLLTSPDTAPAKAQ